MKSVILPKSSARNIYSRMVLSNSRLLILVSVVEELPEKVPRFVFCFATGTCMPACVCVSVCIFLYFLYKKRPE